MIQHSEGISGTLLITGSAGFIGSSLIPMTEDAQVLEIAHSWTSKNELRDLISGHKIDSCIHLGWYASSPDYLYSEEKNRQSYERSLELVELLLEQECTHLTAVGSGAEYIQNSTFLVEGDPTNDDLPYLHYKGLLREHLLSLNSEGGLKSAWCRIFNVIGPKEHQERLIPTIIGRLINSQPIDLTAGTQIRDYLHVDDVARAIISVSIKRLSGIYNICSGEPVEMRTLWKDIAADLDGLDLLNIGFREPDKYDPPCRIGSNAKLCADTSWRRQINYTEMIRDTVSYWTSRLSKGN